VGVSWVGQTYEGIARVGAVIVDDAKSTIASGCRMMRGEKRDGPLARLSLNEQSG